LNPGGENDGHASREKKLAVQGRKASRGSRQTGGSRKEAINALIRGQDLRKGLDNLMRRGESYNNLEGNSKSFEKGCPVGTPEGTHTKSGRGGNPSEKIRKEKSINITISRGKGGP